MLSASIVLAVMSVYHQELTKRNSREEGPVTHITFGKIQPPPDPLEKLVVKTTREEDLLTDLKLGITEELGLEQYALVLPPPIPGAYWTPTFITLNQLTMLCRLEENKESVHDRLMRELPDAPLSTDVGPVRNPKKHHRTSSYLSEDIYYAAPVYKPATNTATVPSKKP
jgi:hypothetical protein